MWCLAALEEHCCSCILCAGHGRLCMSPPILWVGGDAAPARSHLLAALVRAVVSPRACSGLAWSVLVSICCSPLLLPAALRAALRCAMLRVAVCLRLPICLSVLCVSDLFVLVLVGSLCPGLGASAAPTGLLSVQRPKASRPPMELPRCCCPAPCMATHGVRLEPNGCKEELCPKNVPMWLLVAALRTGLNQRDQRTGHTPDMVGQARLEAATCLWLYQLMFIAAAAAVCKQPHAPDTGRTAAALLPAGLQRTRVGTPPCKAMQGHGDCRFAMHTYVSKACFPTAQPVGAPDIKCMHVLCWHAPLSTTALQPYSKSYHERQFIPARRFSGPGAMKGREVNAKTCAQRCCGRAFAMSLPFIDWV